MNILFVSNSYFPHVNGVSYFVHRLAVLLQKKGHRVGLLVPSATSYHTYQLIDGLRVYGVPSLPILLYPKLRFPIAFRLRTTVRRLLLELKPDVIHVQDHFMLAKTVVSVNKKLAIPIVGTNHFMAQNLTALLPVTTFNERLETWLWSDFVQVFNQLDRVTTPTSMAAQLIRSKLVVAVLPVSNGIDLTRFQPVGDSAALRQTYAIPDKPVLLYVGRLDPEKQLDTVLRAVALALSRVDFCLVVVGKGTKRASLEGLAHQLGIRQHVLFTGFISDAELPLFYRLGRCFIMASTAELQSISTLEAMASGLPVIAARAGALAELVHDGDNGYLVEPGDTKTMSHCIEQLIHHESLAKTMGHASLALVRQHDINRTLHQFETIYDQLIRKNDE